MWTQWPDLGAASFRREVLTFKLSKGHMSLVDPQVEENIRRSFANQAVNATIGATLAAVRPGEVMISLPFAQRLTQQNGFLHAGVVATIADSACGYAAMTLAPLGHNPLTVEFKINLLAPARGDHFEARARILRNGKTLTIAQADVFALTESRTEDLIATLLETVIVRPIRTNQKQAKPEFGA
jgi:uncharacterized protein (TIGR00369 family)